MKLCKLVLIWSGSWQFHVVLRLSCSILTSFILFVPIMPVSYSDKWEFNVLLNTNCCLKPELFPYTLLAWIFLLALICYPQPFPESSLSPYFIWNLLLTWSSHGLFCLVLILISIVFNASIFVGSWDYYNGLKLIFSILSPYTSFSCCYCWILHFVSNQPNLLL